MKMLGALRAKPEGKDLADIRLKEVRDLALKKLEHVRDLFPHFTDHSARHVDGVVAVLDWLLPDELKKKLNEWELYFLVAAAYLHDIGMVEGCPGPPSGPEWETFLGQYDAQQREAGVTDESAILLAAKRDFVRDHHHERSEEYITREWRELGLRASDTPAEGEMVGRIALGHRKVHLGDKTAFGEVPFGQNQLIRRDLLAAYLRLADELDTTAHRTPWAEYEVLNNLDETAALEYAKHLSIGGVSGQEGLIVVAGTCHDHDVFLRLNRLHRDLRNKLAELKRMLPRPYATGDGFSMPDPLPYHDVDFKIEHVGYLPIEIKFELQDEEITKLIMGERLYGDETACIRELLQNAVDTCREARERRPAKWEASIVVAEEEDGRVLSVTDNGMGMDEYIVLQYFAKVGMSYYTSADFKGTFRPISEFGIGILSCFMLADSIEVDSFREGSEPIHLELRSLTEPFVPKPGSRKEPGTTVRLHLKPDKVATIDVLERVRHFARHVEFPIAVTSRGGATSVVTDAGFALTADDLADVLGFVDQDETEEYSPRWSPEAIARAHKTVEVAGTRVGVTLLGDLAPWWVSGGGRVSQHGFLVGPPGALEGVMDRTWVEVDVGDQNVLTLTADRTRTGQDSRVTWHHVAELYSQALEALYRRTGQKGSPSHWWSFHLSYYDDTLHYDDTLWPLPQALANSARQNAWYCTLTSEGFRPRLAAEVAAWKGDVYAVPIRSHEELERVRALLSPHMCLVAIPPGAQDQPAWFARFAALDAAKESDDLVGSLGIRLRVAQIAGREVEFVDAGFPLGTWRARWRWLKESSALADVMLDSRHPFSQVLIRSCTGTLPQRSHDVVAELLRLAGHYTPDELQRRQAEALEVLKAEGVIYLPRRSSHRPWRRRWLHTNAPTVRATPSALSDQAVCR